VLTWVGCALRLVGLQVAMAGSAAGGTSGTADGTGGDDTKNAAARCRVLLRFVWEVYRAGIYEDVDAVPVRFFGEHLSVPPPSHPTSTSSHSPFPHSHPPPHY
jgi:hypothetical protein